jgi:putative Ig domain-containing protein
MRKPMFNNSIALRSLFACMALSAAAVAHAQNIYVTAANASNDEIYAVNFANRSITVENTDQGTLHSLRSLAFIPNSTNLQLDLLAADSAGGEIVRYFADFNSAATPPANTKGVVVWNSTEGGPTNPDGLSVDAAGNLFVVNSGNGTSSVPQLWVLLPGPGGTFTPPPQPIDANYGAKQTLEETLISETTIPLPANAVCMPPPAGTCLTQISPGDLLVLTANPALVLLYRGSNPHGPLGPTTPFTLINLPVGTTPGGLAFWPVDNSLLVTTNTGTVFQYAFGANFSPGETPGTFVSGLGNGEFKVKTGRQNGTPYAFVADNNGGRLLEFDQVGGKTQLVATVTQGVQHPQGLATTNAAYAQLSTCQDQQTNGCDLLGGNVITHNVPPNLSLVGNVLEDVCVVPVDPRLAQPNSSCTTDLPVSQVCAGFSNDNVVIPATLCGSSGPTGQGFALVKTLTQGYGTPGMFPFNGALIANDSNLGNVLPPSPNNPVCNPPFPNPPSLEGTLTWAPLTGEGIVVEGNNILELTSGCDGSGSKGYGLSLFGIGLGLNASAIAPMPPACPTGGLVGFACAKYGTVLETIQGQVNENVLPQPVPPSSPMVSSSSLPGNFTFLLQQCIDESQAAFAKGSPASADYSGAALQLLAADQQVLAVATLAAPFTADSDYPNPSGALRSRLQNMYYTINTRLNLQAASSGPPSPPPSPPPPTISGTPATTAKVGTPYLFQPSAADFAGDMAPQSYLTFSIVGKPSWATFNVFTGLLSGSPVKGTYPGIVITVTDGCASKSLPAFSIRVIG